MYRLLEEAVPDSTVKYLIEELLDQLRKLQGDWENKLERRQLLVFAYDYRARANWIKHGVGHPFVDISEQQLYIPLD